MAEYHIYSGITSSWLTLSSYDDYMYIHNGGSANYTTLNGAYMLILSGGYAANTTISNGGTLLIGYDYGGGSANNITVKAGGMLYVASGASATNVNWTPCEGYVQVADGAYVTYASNYRNIICCAT